MVIPEPEIEEDTVVTEIIPEDTVVLELPVEEIAEDTVVVEEPLVVEDTVIIEEAPEVINVPPLVVRRGDHPLDLDVGHYVIVGAFSIKENADNYAQRMQAAGFETGAIVASFPLRRNSGTRGTAGGRRARRASGALGR